MKFEVISHTCPTIFWHIDRIFGVLRHALTFLSAITITGGRENYVSSVSPPAGLLY